MANELLTNPDYDPNRLFDAVIARMNLKSDARLARDMDIAPSCISAMRRKKRPVCAATLLRLHDLTGLPAYELRNLMIRLPDVVVG